MLTGGRRTGGVNGPAPPGGGEASAESVDADEHRPTSAQTLKAHQSNKIRTFVVRVRNGRTEWITVSTGLASGALVEVFGDLQPGDTIAARGTDELRGGTEVRTKEAKLGKIISPPTK